MTSKKRGGAYGSSAPAVSFIRRKNERRGGPAAGGQVRGPPPPPRPGYPLPELGGSYSELGGCSGYFSLKGYSLLGGVSGFGLCKGGGGWCFLGCWTPLFAIKKGGGYCVDLISKLGVGGAPP